MSTAKSSSKFLKLVVLAFCLAGTGHALAGALPETDNGRYALSPAGDGVLRLDTRTGAISTCNNSGAGWACYAVPDERAAMDAEIGLLRVPLEWEPRNVQGSPCRGVDRTNGTKPGLEPIIRG